MERSWVDGTCRVCGFAVVITRAASKAFPTEDYWWYCSNKLCAHHGGEHTGDTEQPVWVFNKKTPMITIETELYQGVFDVTKIPDGVQLIHKDYQVTDYELPPAGPPVKKDEHGEYIETIYGEEK